MKERILVIWAVSATLVALGSAGGMGYLYGKKAAQPSAVQQANVESSSRALRSAAPVRPRSESEGGVEAALAYAVPESLAKLPDQWRSSETSGARGYAILFNLIAREVIVEYCQHDGYSLDSSGQPQNVTGATCSSALAGSVYSIEEDQVHVITRDGRTVLVSLNANSATEPMKLELRFEDHQMELQPGSKNDLMQAFEAHPEIKEKRREYLVALASGNRRDDRRAPGQ